MPLLTPPLPRLSTSANPTQPHSIPPSLPFPLTIPPNPTHYRPFTPTHPAATAALGQAVSASDSGTLHRTRVAVYCLALSDHVARLLREWVRPLLLAHAQAETKAQQGHGQVGEGWCEQSGALTARPGMVEAVRCGPLLLCVCVRIVDTPIDMHCGRTERTPSAAVMSITCAASTSQVRVHLTSCIPSLQ